jgi:trigger factor
MTDENNVENQENPVTEDTGAEAASESTTATATAEAPAKLRQDVEINDSGPCKKHIKVTVNREDIDTRIDEKITEIVRNQESPTVAGFRPGKAPRRIVERRYEKEVKGEVRGEVLMASLEQLAEDYDIAPLAPPNIDPRKIEIPKEGPLVYEFDVEVRPQFDLPNYKGIKLKRQTYSFTDADVDKERRRLLEQHGQIVPKGDDATVEIGDYITVDLISRVDGKVMNEVKEAQLRVDERLALRDGVCEDFGAKLRGAKAGEERQVEIALTDAVSDARLKGRKVDATLKVLDVKMLRLPELTEELLGTFGVQTPEQLDELIRVVLDRRLEYQQQQSYRRQILELIGESSKWELPQDLLQRQARRAFQRRVMEMRSAGMSEEEISGRSRFLQRDVMRSTALALKEHFVLQKIAEVEKIDVNDQDLDDEIYRIADRSDESPRRVRARLEREDMMEALAIELIERRTLDLILQNAEYEDEALTQPDQESSVGSTEVQTVAGETSDPTAPPPEEKSETPAE